MFSQILQNVAKFGVISVIYILSESLITCSDIECIGAVESEIYAISMEIVWCRSLLFLE